MNLLELKTDIFVDSWQLSALEELEDYASILFDITNLCISSYSDISLILSYVPLDYSQYIKDSKDSDDSKNSNGKISEIARRLFHFISEKNFTSDSEESITPSVLKGYFTDFIHDIIDGTRVDIPQLVYHQDYICSIIQTYLPSDFNRSNVEILFKSVFKFSQLRSYFTFWYPSNLYTYTMSAVNIKPEDIPVIKEFFPKETSNMMAMLLYIAYDMYKDTRNDNIINIFKSMIYNCQSIQEIRTLLNRSYMQLLLTISVNNV